MEKANVLTKKQISDCFNEIDFPHGISFREIYLMLDFNGDGKLTKEEFVKGTFRIINCTPFQRDCIFLIAMGRNLACQQRLRGEMESQLAKMEGRILKAISSG